MVVIIGLAMTAGSRPRRLAPIGSRQPTDEAITMASISVTETIRLMTTVVPEKIIMRRKLTAASAAPHTTPTRASFHRTRSQSPSSTSPSAMLRMMVTEVWLPELPAEPVSIGMNAVSTTAPASTDSKLVMIVEDSVAEIIMIISHGRRCATRCMTPASMYSSSEGIMAAIFLMSSVFSSVMTSTISSMVMMPTSRFSLSVTAMEVRS